MDPIVTAVIQGFPTFVGLVYAVIVLERRLKEIQADANEDRAFMKSLIVALLIKTGVDIDDALKSAEAVKDAQHKP